MFDKERLKSEIKKCEKIETKGDDAIVQKEFE
jgi:hypothetical protein